MAKLDLDALARAVNGDVTILHTRSSFYRVQVVGVVGRSRIAVDVTGDGYVEAIEAAAAATRADLEAILAPLKEQVGRIEQGINLVRYHVVVDF